MSDREELAALRRLAELEAKAGGGSPSEPSAPPMLDVLRNAAVEGAAGIPDSILNTPTRLLNLAMIPVGKFAADMGRPDLAPDMIADPDITRKLARRIGLTKEGVEPVTGAQKVADVLLRGAVAGGLTGGAGLAKSAIGAGLGALSSGAAAGMESATGSPLAGALAGLAAPAGAAGASRAAGAASRKLMASALKPSAKDWKTGDADRAIRTLLDEGVNATRGGAEKLQGRIGDVNEKIADALMRSTATVSKGKAAAPIYDVEARFAKQAAPQSDLAAVSGVFDDYATNPMIPRDAIPVQLAQELKQGTYRALKDKYGEVGSAATEAQKALARGLKDEISSAVPEVAPLNARESALINAKKIAERRANVDANKNPTGLGTIAPSASRMALFLADRSALVKSLMARAANKGAVPIGAEQMMRSTIPLGVEEEDLRRQRIIDALMSGGM